jgi:hypothetical protein
VLVRVIRQFHQGAESITLAKTVLQPDASTMGTRLDLRTEGVEAALTVVGVTLRSIQDAPGVKPRASRSCCSRSRSRPWSWPGRGAGRKSRPSR